MDVHHSGLSLGSLEGMKPKSFFWTGNSPLMSSLISLYIMLFLGVNYLIRLLPIVMLPFNQLREVVVITHFVHFLHQ